MSNEAVKWAMDDAPMLLTDKGRPDTTARHVLQALAEHAHKDGSSAHPSVLRICYRTGYDERTVQRALRRLEAAELIEADGSVNGCARWRLALSKRRPASDWADLEAQHEDRRKATAERVRKHRSKGVTHSDGVSVTHSPPVTETHSDDVTEPHVTHSESVRNARRVRSVTHSVPPEPSVEPPGNRHRAADKPARARATSAPDDFPITDRMRTWATGKGLDRQRIERETERFLDHHRAKGTTFRDWTAAWRTWMSRSLDYAPRQSAPNGQRYTDHTERGIF